MKRRRGFHAFTLVELLVVIAIIAILIAILIGPIMRARRYALVLACPIVAKGANHAVVLLHPRGSAELEIAPPGSWTHGPCWSTNGTWIGYVRNFPAEHTYRTVIVHAMSGKIRPDHYPNDTYILGWADDNHWITRSTDSHGSWIELYDASTGRLTESIPDISEIGTPIARVPPSTGAYYITSSGSGVALLRKDFSIKKIIYVPNIPNDSPVFGVRVDPMGEYAAWQGGVAGIGGGTCIKSLKAPTSALPEVISFPMIFADWTEDGNLLGYAPANGISIESGANLVILSRTGKPLQAIQKFDPITNLLSLDANYRIYRHQ